MFASNPGQVKDIITVDMPHPRNEQSKEFHELVDQIYTTMTLPERARCQCTGPYSCTWARAHRGLPHLAGVPVEHNERLRPVDGDAGLPLRRHAGGGLSRYRLLES